MKYYMVFDGRAHYDIDAAQILESIGLTSRKKAIKEFKREWGDADAVLVAYDEGEKVLDNPEIVYIDEEDK